MKINLDKFNRHHWFEDEYGNVVPCDTNTDELVNTDEYDYLLYKRVFPLEYSDVLTVYCYHPKNPFIKWLMNHNAKFYKYMLHKHRKEKTFKDIATFNTSYRSHWSQKCIVAMVNSGDYTLEEAVYIYCNSCERCMNVLLHKYLSGEEGYPEYSEEWKKCNTVCDWCREEVVK